MRKPDGIAIFCSGIWDWFDHHKRTLPWRDLAEKDPDHRAYLILVSEIMLQQTQVPRVVILYKKFIQQFPHIEDLAKASNSEALIAWRGLGYNNRALRLRDAARAIVSEHGGKFPSDMEALIALPGIGHYTAAAIRNFAFGIPTACLDTNVRRILHRFFVGSENPDGTWKRDDRYLLALAGKVLRVACPHPAHLAQGETRTPPPGSAPQSGGGRGRGRGPADWHAALMDFGSLVCTKNAPKWQLFSPELKSVCKSYGKNIQRKKSEIKKEPGRMMAGKFVPNRIFRGRIVEALRDAKKGLSIEQIGAAAVADWPVLSEANGTMGDHRKWLKDLIENLKRDAILDIKRTKVMLRS